MQLRQGHWAIVDLVSKEGHIRTAPMLDWIKEAIDRWILGAVTVRRGERDPSAHTPSITPAKRINCL